MADVVVLNDWQLARRSSTHCRQEVGPGLKVKLLLYTALIRKACRDAKITPRISRVDALPLWDRPP